MAATKISALAANAALVGTEQLPAVQSGGNVKTTPADLARYFSATPKPPKCSFHGDSIAQLLGNLEPMSPLFQAIIRQPRNFYMSYTGWETSGTLQSGNFALSGKISGPLWTGLGRTGSLVTAGDTGNMNDATRLASVTAYAPDIMFIEIGSNESANTTSALDATILNTKDVINANPNPNKKIVIFAPFPKASYSPHVMNFTRWAEQMARNTPGYYFVDWRSFSIDESSATGIPLATDSADGVHPNVANAIKMVAPMNNLLDRLGIEKTSPRGVSQVDVYNSTTAPAGNMLGTKGVFAGTAGSTNGNTSGSVATGWSTSTSNAEVTATMSKGTFTDRDGRVHQAQIATFGGSTTTAVRYFELQCASFSTLRQAQVHYSQILAQLTSVVGCTGAGFYIQSGNGTPIAEARMGLPMLRAIQTTDVIPTSATPLDYYLVNPVALMPNSVNTAAFYMYVRVYFATGYVPAGTAAFGAAGVWPEVTAL